MIINVIFAVIALVIVTASWILNVSAVSSGLVHVISFGFDL